MPVGVKKLFDTKSIQVASAAESAYINFGDVTPRKVTLYIEAEESGSGAGVAMTAEVSPDEGQTLITYDKMIDGTGVDSPVASVTYDTTGDDVVSLSLEDAVEYLQITMTDSGSASGANYITFSVWAVYTY